MKLSPEDWKRIHARHGEGTSPARYAARFVWFVRQVQRWSPVPLGNLTAALMIAGTWLVMVIMLLWLM